MALASCHATLIAHPPPLIAAGILKKTSIRVQDVIKKGDPRLKLRHLSRIETPIAAFEAAMTEMGYDTAIEGGEEEDEEDDCSFVPSDEEDGLAA